MRGLRSSPGAQSARKVAVCARVALGDDEVAPAYEMCNKSTVRRRPRRRLSRGGAALVWSVASLVAIAGCGGSSRHADAPATTVTEPSSTSKPTSTTVPAVGQQAFAAYQHAFGVIADIEGSPTGRSTDPQLRSLLIDPWFTQIAQEINVYRFRDEVVRGLYSFTNFHLDQVTADGRVIFTDCQVNGQAVYNAKSGALVGNSGTGRLAEQVVVFHPSPDVWQVADDNAVTSDAAGICAA